MTQDYNFNILTVLRKKLCMCYYATIEEEIFELCKKIIIRPAFMRYLPEFICHNSNSLR